jgi:hypothetical protein
MSAARTPTDQSTLNSGIGGSWSDPEIDDTKGNEPGVR